MEGTMSEIRFFAPDFAPKAWAYCQGQTLPIAQNQALFSLLGTVYGGNGVTTFALPNFASRTVVGTGTGPGLSPITLGETQGTSETVTLNTLQMPAHNHPGQCTITIPAFSETGTQAIPSNAHLASLAGLYSSAAADTTLAPMGLSPVISVAGGNQPISVLQPYLAINVIICLMGIFPSRN